MPLGKLPEVKIIHVIKLCSATLIFISLLLIDIKVVKADVFKPKNIFLNVNGKIEKSLLSREINQPLTLTDVSFKYNLSSLDRRNNYKQLRRTSFYLRDIARSFGSDLPIYVPILNGEIQENRYSFTTFKNSEGKWTNLTTGYVLSLVTQELNSLDTNQNQPLIDFIVKDDLSNDDNYRLILKVPLNFYCQELVNFLQFRFNQNDKL